MRSILLSGLALCALATAPAAARPSVAQLAKVPAVAKLLAKIRADEPQTIADQIAVTEIAAPSFQEATRAKDFLRRMRELGLNDASIDQTGNVVGLRRGSGKGPLLVVSAHLDTVFPPGDVPKVIERDGRLYGHGIADDGRGLAVLLAMLRTLQGSGLRTVGDILFVATVGEEGLGNIRGAKGLFASRKDIDGFITVEPSLGQLTGLANGASGSRRWDFTFTGPGGHSFENFGSPSAIHAMGRAIALISELRPPSDPKTTFNVGVVSGGTSVNTIAPSATMTVDIRSNTNVALAAMEEKVIEAAERGAAQETARWSGAAITVSRKLLGDRGAGTTPPDAPLVRAAVDAVVALGRPAPKLVTNSTDSNAAISLGVPGLMMVGGGNAGGLHSPGEWFEPKDSYLGPQSVLLTTLALVGVEGVAPPMLAKMTGR